MSTFSRRNILQMWASCLPSLAQAQSLTKFQIACMTLPYAEFPLQRALRGISDAGYRYVAWGTTHKNASGQKEPVIAKDADAKTARALAAQCRDLGLTPVMMFSEIYVAAPESVSVHTRRIEQAAAAGIPFLLTFGSAKGDERKLWVENLKALGPVARSANVTIVIKQHGGNTATGADCERIIADVADSSVKICYDAGNVLDYNNDDPISDIQTCWKDIRAFAIKDHRNTPKDQDCGPGFGEIDHYKLLASVMHTGLTMPLACENISEPLVPRPIDASKVDVLAKRAREYLESVIQGLQAV
jgi:sugar phosphate isomerase/epimerase